MPGVRTVHNLRLWSLTMTKTALSAHLAVDPTYNQQRVLRCERFSSDSDCIRLAYCIRVQCTCTSTVQLRESLVRESHPQLHHCALSYATRLIRDEFGIFDVTIQLEDYVLGMEHCDDCAGPLQ